MTVMVLIMLVCFAGNIVFFFGRIHYGELALGFIPGKVSGWQIIVSMSATTFSIAGAACQSYLVQGKGWTMDNYDKAGRDSTAGIIIFVMYYSYHTDNRSHHPAKRSGDYQCSIHRGTAETFTGRICKRALSAWIFCGRILFCDSKCGYWRNVPCRLTEIRKNHQ